MTRTLAYLPVLVLAMAAPVAALDMQFSPNTGSAPTSLKDDTLALNRADGKLFYRKSDGSLGTSTLLNALPSGRRAIEQGQADDLTVGGAAISAILGSKAPLASPTFSGTVTAPAVALTGSGLAGKVDSATSGGLPISTFLGSINGKPSMTARYAFFGQMSHDALGNFNEDGGGAIIGGPGGILIKQEGSPLDKEEGSLAMYPQTVNRGMLVSLAPSGAPGNIPSENISGIAMQLQNNNADGSQAEERLTISAKYFGADARAYRIAPYANGAGRFWPLEMANGTVIQEYLPNGTTRFTNRLGGQPGSGGNTIVSFENPSHTNKLVNTVRQNGVMGTEVWTGGVYRYTMEMAGVGPLLNSPQPAVTWFENDVPADNGRWFIDAEGGQLRGFATNDGLSQFGQWLGINRNGANWNEIGLGGAAGAPGTLALVRDSGGTINVVARFLRTFTNDAAAAAATPPVPVKGLYNDASGVVRVRLN